MVRRGKAQAKVTNYAARGENPEGREDSRETKARQGIVITGFLQVCSSRHRLMALGGGCRTADTDRV